MHSTKWITDTDEVKLQFSCFFLLQVFFLICFLNQETFIKEQNGVSTKVLPQIKGKFSQNCLVETQCKCTFCISFQFTAKRTYQR